MRRAFKCVPLVTLALVSLAIVQPAYAATELKTTTVGGVTVSEETANKLKGTCTSDPFQALRPYIQGGQVIPKASGGGLRDGIDPELACRLSKFLEYANKSVCPTKIISGYRSHAQQASMCGAGRSGCAPAGSSCHQYGLAVDLTSDCGGRLRRMAPQFKLTFPYYGIHVQCAEHRGASRRSCNRSCDGGAEISPDMNALAQIAASPGQPMSLGDAFRQATGLGLQPAIPPQPALPPQAIPQYQQPTQYFPQDTPVTTGPSTPGQPGQPVGTPISISDGGEVSPTSPKDRKQKELEEETETLTDRGPSIADQLLMLAYGTSSIATSTEVATTVPIIVTDDEAVELKSGGKATTSASSASSTLSGKRTLRPTQTFISGDLSYPQFPGTGSRSEIIAFLADMRERLLRALEILRPFGLRGEPLRDGRDYRIE